MATNREKLDTRGANILQLLQDNQEQMSNMMNPSAKDAGTYKGPNPDKDIEINYPRTPSTLGGEPGKYTTYFLREFDLGGKDMGDFGTGGNQYEAGSGILTQAEQDTGQAANASLQGTIRDRFQGRSHKLPYRDSTDADFMKLKHRKSLMTLYWEMRDVFIGNRNEPKHTAPESKLGSDSLKTYSNRFTGEPNATYDEQFLSQTREVYYPPNDSFDLQISAQNGFILGQILGPNKTVIQNLIDSGKQLTRQYLQGLAADADNPFLEAFILMISGMTLGTADRVSQLFRPGFSRIALPDQIVMPLSELLQQNLLLPPEGMLATGSTNDVDEFIEGTFQELYTRNRAVHPVDPRYSAGVIAGTGVNDLQEPIRGFDGQVYNVTDGKTAVPFTFKDDDAKYLTHSAKTAGFNTNGPMSTTNPHAMEPAVRDYRRGHTFEEEAADNVVSTDGQYFPFAFSTVNKKDHRVQVCCLQATIQSLSESYNPTWQSKHFFGRSEQVHTYTFTDRTIDISFAVFATSLRKLQNVYERVLWLAQQCYPDYSDKDRIGSGPIIAMRCGDLFQYKSGFIRSLSYDWNYLGAGGKWEMTRGIRIPQGVNVQLSFQVIHERVPDRDYNFYGGPAGGVGQGMKQHRQLDYPNRHSGWQETALAQGGLITSTERYIPAGNMISKAEERKYLDFVDATQQARNPERSEIQNREPPVPLDAGERTTGGRDYY